MKKLSAQRLFYCLLLLWFMIDLVQISTTGLLYDEVYYFSWGQHLDWGYFDHPPMVAVLTYLGDLFFDGSWSIRFFSALLHVFTIFFIWKTIGDEHKQTQKSILYFFGLAFTLPMFTAYGFITTPDSALLFFFALSIWAFKRFTEHRNSLDIIWLSLGISGMILSKYHAFLILFLALILYWKIIKKRRFRIVLIVVMLIVTPHFLWLYEHDFITFKYHLIERSKGFQLKYLLEYIPGQFAVLNPYYLSLFLIMIFKRHKLDRFNKNMRFFAVGILLFFTLMIFKGRVEAHWTTIASIPILFVVFPYILELSQKKSYPKYIIGGFVVIIFGIRTLIMFNKLPKINFDECKIEYYQKMNDFVEQKPVVFIGSFQEPASYYYANKGAGLANKAFYRKRHTQFELWGWQNKFVGQEVFIAPKTFYYAPEHNYMGEMFRGWFIDYFQDSRFIKINHNLKETQLKKGKTYALKLNIKNTSTVDYNFKSSDMPLQVKAIFIGEDPVKTVSVRLPLYKLDILKAGDSQSFETSFTVPKKLNEKNYIFNISIFSKLGTTSNSQDTLVEVLD